MRQLRKEVKLLEKSKTKKISLLSVLSLSYILTYLILTTKHHYSQWTDEATEVLNTATCPGAQSR